MHQGSRLPSDELLNDGDTHCYLLLLPLASKKPILVWGGSNLQHLGLCCQFGLQGMAEVFLGTSSLLVHPELQTSATSPSEALMVLGISSIPVPKGSGVNI